MNDDLRRAWAQRDVSEQSWTPDGRYLATLPDRHTLLLDRRPGGAHHLMLDHDHGQWWHLKPAGRVKVTAGQAVHLRPDNVADIVQFTALWARHRDVNPVRAEHVIAELGHGIQLLVSTLAGRTT